MQRLSGICAICANNFNIIEIYSYLFCKHIDMNDYIKYIVFFFKLVKR